MHLKAYNECTGLNPAGSFSRCGEEERLNCTHVFLEAFTLFQMFIYQHYLYVATAGRAEGQEAPGLAPLAQRNAVSLCYSLTSHNP